MNFIQIELLIIVLLVSITCALPGVFLVLRGVALMSDAISHSILLGIVVMFLVMKSLYSPILFCGALLSGMATVWCTEWLIQTGCLKKDVAIGLVFPLFFSIGIILITVYGRNIHLDADIVLLGDIAFAPFQRCIVYGYDCGPIAVWHLVAVLFLNIGIITLFFKELRLVTFDQEYASVAGFAPHLVHYLIMSLTSITAIASFDIAGAIVVVAFIIIPPATAFLVTKQLGPMLLWSIFFGFLSSFLGFAMAIVLDVSIVGSIAVMSGMLFTLIFLMRLLPVHV